MFKYLIGFIIGAFLFRLGGWGKFGKFPRRFLLPFIITLYNWIKIKKWRIWFLFPFLILGMTLGYGEKYPYWRKFLTGIAWVLPRFIFLGFGWFALFVPFIWIGLFWLSNHKPYSDIFKWNRVEIIIGGLLGMSYMI